MLLVIRNQGGIPFGDQNTVNRQRKQQKERHKFHEIIVYDGEVSDKC